MQVLAVLEGNLVVVEPRLETVLRHANVDFCVTKTFVSVKYLVYYIRLGEMFVN